MRKNYHIYISDPRVNRKLDKLAGGRDLSKYITRACLRLMDSDLNCLSEARAEAEATLNEIKIKEKAAQEHQKETETVITPEKDKLLAAAYTHYSRVDPAQFGNWLVGRRNDIAAVGMTQNEVVEWCKDQDKGGSK